jgi:hypothetical protein
MVPRAIEAGQLWGHRMLKPFEWLCAAVGTMVPGWEAVMMGWS